MNMHIFIQILPNNKALSANLSYTYLQTISMFEVNEHENVSWSTLKIWKNILTQSDQTDSL